MKKRIILLSFIIFICLTVGLVAYFKIFLTTDNIKFKDEYESYNNLDNGYGGKYLKISIDKNNPFKYSNYDEILNLIDNGTGIIFLGFPECPWCRNSIKTLIDVAKDYNIETIYYLNIKNERDSYTVEDDKLAYEVDSTGNELKGSKGYHKLLKALDEYLSDYTIILDDKTYETGEKRIYAPSVIFVRDGNVLGIHVSTVVSHTDPSVELTKEQREELYQIYEGYILKMNSSTCPVDSAC